MSDGMRRNVRMGLDARWYETECLMRRDLWPDDMGRNALCEGTCGPMIWDEMPYAKGLGSIFFVFEL